MPAKPRSSVFDPDVVGVYHCWNRLVRQRHLFGWDALTGRDFSYRKDWVRNRFRELAGKMAIEVLDYAILDNHLHVVLRNRPDLVATWSDDEIARRWWFVCPDRRNDDGSIPEPKPCEIALLLPNVDEYRSRLSDISWMMRLACQPIALRANKEDGVEGRFFAKRFDCRRLKTEADILNCSLYVDLNWIRAGLASSPETSQFTSAFDRIQARWQRVRREMNPSTAAQLPPPADDWLAPIFLDERSEVPAISATSHDMSGREFHNKNLANPIGSARLSDKGFLPITTDQYLSLLDAVGRIIRRGARGRIPAHLPPILQRLGLEPQPWLNSLLKRFRPGLRCRAHPPPLPACHI